LAYRGDGLIRSAAFEQALGFQRAKGVCAHTGDTDARHGDLAAAFLDPCCYTDDRESRGRVRHFFVAVALAALFRGDRHFDHDFARLERRRKSIEEEIGSGHRAFGFGRSEAHLGFQR